MKLKTAEKLGKPDKFRNNLDAALPASVFFFFYFDGLWESWSISSLDYQCSFVGCTLPTEFHLHLILSCSFPSLKLRSLRVNVGQLLATIMPDLDLQQVNYDIDVVDEILGQVVEQMHEISST